MGRTPDPINTRAARGTLRQGEAVSAVTALVVALPDPPAWLKGEGLAEWRRAGAAMLESETVTTSDRAALALYCEAWGEWCHIVKEIAQQRRLRNQTLLWLRKQRGTMVRQVGSRVATDEEAAAIAELDRQLERLADPMIAYTPNAMVQISQLAVLRDRLWKQVAAGAAALGLSPTTRAKATRVTKAAKADEDELAAWAQKRGG